MVAEATTFDEVVMCRLPNLPTLIWLPLELRFDSVKSRPMHGILELEILARRMYKGVLFG